ncbi:MAG: transposase [candidate division Zixibacteria bacterium]|nr:transposase [candidate division Zixibacteria bacterium]
MGLRHRQNLEGGCYFITTSVIGFVKVFDDPECSKIIIDSLNFCQRKFKFHNNAYVIMPNHIHLILTLNENTKISNIMRDFKKYTSVAIKRYFAKGNNIAIYNQLQKHVPSKSNRSFILWQPRFDDLQIFTEKVFLVKMRYIIYNPVRAGLVSEPEDWQYLYYESMPD